MIKENTLSEMNNNVYKTINTNNNKINKYKHKYIYALINV